MSNRATFLGGLRERYGAKLALALVAVVALFVAFGGLISVQAQDTLRQDVRGDLQTTAETRAATLDTWLSGVVKQTRLASDHPTLRSGNTEQVGTYLSELVAEDTVPSGVTAVHYYDRESKRIVASSTEQFVGVNPAEQGAPFATSPPSFDGVEGVHVSAPFRVPVVDFPVVAVVSPVAGDGEHAVIYMVNLNEKAGQVAGSTGAQQTYIVNDRGTYVAHPDAARVLTDYGGGTVEGFFDGTAFRNREDTLLAAAPMGATNWAVVVETPSERAFALGSQITADVVALVLLAVISLSLVGVTIGSNTVISLRQLSAKADRMADGDLDVAFESTRRDEFGTLVDSFADMRDSLSENIAEAEDARQEADERRREAEAMAAALEEKAGHYEEVMVACADGDLTRRVDPESRNDAMESIGESFNDMMEELERTVASVAQFATHVSEATAEVDAGAEEVMDATAGVTDQVEGIADGAHTQSETLGEVSEEMGTLSASAEEIAATVDEVADTSQRAADAGEDGRSAAEDALAEMDAVERETEEAVAAIEQLDEEMAAIGEVVDVITDIAEQTNLLALNASIEAARTGEGGDGFAVVADEVKSLAEETKASAEEIEGRIQRIQGRTTETVDGIRRTSDRVTAGVDTVENAIDSLERIVERVEEIDTSIQEINDATEDQADSTQAVVARLDEVSDISERTSESAREVTTAADQQAETLATMSDSVGDLSDRASTLMDLVEDFRVEADGPDSTARRSPGVADDD
jgi:methyl-accepting chemotaxis protein